MRRVLGVVVPFLITTTAASVVRGQDTIPPYRVSWLGAASAASAAGLYLVPSVAGLPHGGPSCAPCDPATLPGVDRWALRSVSATADRASDVVLGGVAGLTAWASLGGLPREEWRGNFLVLANVATWTAASAEWLKVVIRRKRPVLYSSDTSVAIAAAADRENEQSLPSIHSSLAFAAATSYVVIASREHLPHRTRNALLLYAAAVGVSVLRVAAGQHFPTDVVAGAALGTGIGWLVPTVYPVGR